MKLIFKEFR